MIDIQTVSSSTELCLVSGTWLVAFRRWGLDTALLKSVATIAFSGKLGAEQGEAFAGGSALLRGHVIIVVCRSSECPRVGCLGEASIRCVASGSGRGGGGWEWG